MPESAPLQIKMFVSDINIILIDNIYYIFEMKLFR